MAIFAELFDGTKLEFPDGTDQSVIDKVAREETLARTTKPDTGFTGAFKSSVEKIKGEAALTAGKLGLMDEQAAENFHKGREEHARNIYKQTEKGWTEDPITKFKELLGGSVPYIAAPAVAAGAALLLPEAIAAAPILGGAAGIGGALGLGTIGAATAAGAATLASAAQFTGSNLAAQMETGKSLEDTSLAKAALASIPQALLDTASFKMTPGIRKLFGSVGKEISEETAQKIAKQGLLATTGRVALSSGKTAAIEGFTEAGQQVFERLQADLSLTDEKARQDYIDNFIGGAVLGGVLGGFGHAFDRSKKQSAAPSGENAPTGGITTPTAPAQEEAPEERYVSPLSIDPLKNPLGNFTRDEAPEIYDHVQASRAARGKPALPTTFSIEDMADAGAPKQAIDSMVANKSGWNGEKVSASDVLNRAQQKNIDTSTKGFRDFLRRATGTDDINTLSEPQLFVAAKALDAIKPGEEQRILEPGTNALHYTPDQYSNAVNGLRSAYAKKGDTQLDREDAVQAIMDSTGLKEPIDAERVLEQAVADGHIDQTRETETEAESFKPSDKQDMLPGGFDIREEAFKQGDEPEEHDVKAGSQTLSSHPSREKAEETMAQHVADRTKELNSRQKEIDKLNKDIENRKRELVRLQSIGEGSTFDFYSKSAETDVKNKEDQASIEKLKAEQAQFAQPLKITPRGTKPKNLKTRHALYKDDKRVGHFDDQYQAERHGISLLSNDALKNIVEIGPKLKGLRAKRYAVMAKDELGYRENPSSRPQPKAAFDPKLKEKMDALHQALIPTLKRFGLESVGLKIEESIRGGTANGEFSENLIRVAMDAENGEYMGTLRHESIHALKELGAFTPAEWKTLEAMAKKEWINKFLSGRIEAYKDQYKSQYGNLNGFDAYIAEEAIADAFKYFSGTKPPAGFVANLMRRLNELFKAIKQAFGAAGYKSSDEIFRGIEEGQYRPAGEATSGSKYSLKNTSSLKNAFEMAKSKDYVKNRDFKIELQKAVQEAAKNDGIRFNGTDKEEGASDETTRHLVDVGTEDALYSLLSNANAMGWYDKTVSKALDIISLIHPEIKTDPDAKLAFTWGLAVTSNGIKVDKNFELAEQVYTYYKKHKKMPTDIKAGLASVGINKGLKTFNDLSKRWTMSDIRKFMATEMPAGLVTRVTGIAPTGENADTDVLGASIIGPKIGNGFFSNLNGIFDQLTMDRWLMRTWGRWTGSLIEVNQAMVGESGRKVKDLVDKALTDKATLDIYEKHLGQKITESDLKDESSVENLANKIVKASTKPDIREELNTTPLGEEIRKAANNFVKYIDGQKEAPENGHERKYIRKVFNGILNNMHDRGYNDMTMADLQALLWYPERRLYDTSKESDVDQGYADDEAPDYANAATKLALRNGVPEAKIKQVAKQAEEDYVRRTAAARSGVSTGETSLTGRAVGFTGKAKKDFATRNAIRSYLEHDGTSPRAFQRRSDKNGKKFRVLRHDAIFEYSPDRKFNNALKSVGSQTPAFYEMPAAAAKDFHKAIQNSKKSSEYGAAVYVYPEEDYAKMRLFMSKDGKAGFALKGDDIVSVFSQSPHVGAVNGIMQLATQLGGRRLDAFDTVLPDLYFNNGFTIVGRSKWNEDYKPDDWSKETFKKFNNGEPDIVYMAYKPKVKERPTNQQGQYVESDTQAYELQQATSKGVKYGKYSLKAPNTPEFKRWFGKSKIVNPDGTPKVMYHGTARDITEFRAKQADAIFVTDKPEFADTFASLSFDKYVVKETFENLSEKEKRSVANKGIALALKNKEISKEAAQRFREREPSVAFDMLDSVKELVVEKTPTGKNIMPLFVRAENPFDYENPQHIKELVNHPSFNVNLGHNEYAIGTGSWKDIENSGIQRIIKDLGHDGFYVKEGGVKNLAVYNQNQIKSATGNTGAFSTESNDIRYSMKGANSAPFSYTKMQEQRNAGKVVRDTIDNINAKFNQDAYTDWRIKWVDTASGVTKTLQGEGIFDTSGQLRADGLLHAKNQAINLIRNGMLEGVVRVNSDGTLGVEYTDQNLARSLVLADELDAHPMVKGHMESGRKYIAEIARALRAKDILAEDKGLRELGTQQLEESKHLLELARGMTGRERERKVKQAYALRKKARENMKMNRERKVDQAQIDWAEKQYANNDKVREILGIWKHVNDSLVDLGVETGWISKEDAATYKARKNYVPLYLSRDDLSEDSFFNLKGTGVKTSAKIHKLKGSEEDLNIWENMDKHYASMVARSYENQTRRAGVAQLVWAGAAHITSSVDKNSNIVFKDAGKDVYAIVENPNDLAAFATMQYQMGPIMKAFGVTTKVLRFGALVNPMYWIKQLIKDPIHAYMTGTTGMVTPFHSARAFLEIISQNSKEAKILKSRGVIGPVGTTEDIYSFLSEAGKDKADPKRLNVIMHKIMQAHEASDAATRVEIYKKAYKEALAKGYSEDRAVNEAVHKARESINFSNRGNSPVLNSLRQMIPFLSAQITSLDTVYRAMTGYGLNPKEKAEAQRIFRSRAMLLMASSLAYAMLMQDDDEYKKLPDYIKDDNWLMPSPTGHGFIKIPTAFEVGFLFKAIPEMAVRYMSGTSTGKEVLISFRDGFLKNVPAQGLPIPQATKPILETITNHSFFTGNPIEGMSDQGKPIATRGARASETAKLLSAAGLDKLTLSPAKIDNLFQGFAAELGTFSLGMIDQLVYSAEGKNPPPKNIEQLPFMKSFMTDRNVDRAVSEFYKIESEAKQTVQGFNDLKAHGQAKQAAEYISDEDRKKMYNAAPALRKIGEQMTNIRKQMAMIEGNEDIPADVRRERLNSLTQTFNRVAENGLRVSTQLGLR